MSRTVLIFKMRGSEIADPNVEIVNRCFRPYVVPKAVEYTHAIVRANVRTTPPGRHTPPGPAPDLVPAHQTSAHDTTPQDARVPDRGPDTGNGRDQR